jgi:LysR family transcriptional regulator, hydrogen peroxide-inducible genes activator
LCCFGHQAHGAVGPFLFVIIIGSRIVPSQVRHFCNQSFAPHVSALLYLYARLIAYIFSIEYDYSRILTAWTQSFQLNFGKYLIESLYDIGGHLPSLQQLRYLVAISDHLNFRRAAEQCHVTQPTLSAQLAELERRLGGVTLVERSRTNVLMTELGVAVVAKARAMFRELDEIQMLVRVQGHGLNGTLKIGVVQALGSYLLPLILPDLRAHHADLGFYTREDSEHILLDQLEAGALDILFFVLPQGRSGLTEYPLVSEPLFVVTAADHPFAQQATVSPTDLSNQKLLSLQTGHRLYDQTSEVCRLVGAQLSHDYEGTSLDAIRHMVALGGGISLMPALYVQSEVDPRSDVKAIPLSGAPVSRTIGLVWRDSSALASEYRLFGELVRRILVIKAPKCALSCDGIDWA